MDPQDIDLSQRIFILSKTYSAIKTYFAHWKAIPDLEIDSLYNMIIPRVSRASNRYEFDLTMIEFLSQLQNGHTWYTDRWLELKYGKNFNFKFTYLDEQWVILSSQDPKMTPGDVIASINDEEFNMFFNRKKKYISASSIKAKKDRFYRYNYLFPKQFSLTFDDGKTVDIIQSKKQNSTKRQIDPLRPTHKSIKNKDIFYIKIPSFGITQI
jgi:carboxyl-terminal processing protease